MAALSSKLLLLWGAFFGLLSLTLLLGAADSARAGTFNPTLEVEIANPEPEVPSDFTVDFGLPAGDVNFAVVVSFIPGDWGVVRGADIAIGTEVGSLTSTATLGLINAACNTPLPVAFTFQNGSLDTADTVSFLDEDENGTGDAFEDKDDSGLKDAVEKFPAFITRIVPDAQPIRRSVGITSVAGVNVLLQYVVYEVGTLINEALPSDPELGYPTLVFLQNIGDPEADPVPSPITDFCTPLTSNNIALGQAEDGTQLYVNPKDGTYKFTTFALGQRDADNDGIMNSMDTCPFVANVGDPTIPGDGDLDSDGLDGACDPDDNDTKSDEDDDGYPNRGDNCSLIANGEDGTNQADDDIDQIGNECDTNPDTADGELAEAQLSVDVPIGTGEGEGGPPEGFGADGGGGDGGGLSTGALIGIIAGVVAAVVVIGGGAAYAMRRRS